MKIRSLFLALFAITQIVAQTTYTFTGSGNWTEPTNWDAYPGTIINAGDAVIIDNFRYVIIPATIIIQNSGTITLNMSSTFENRSGATFNNLLTGELTANIFASIDNKSTINNYGSIHLSDSSELNNEAGELNNYTGGTIILMNFSGLFNDPISTLNNLSGGAITFNSGAQINDGLITNSGTITLSNLTELYNGMGGFVLNQIDGTMTSNNSSLFNSGTFNNLGTISGNNINHTGNINNQGILSPGNSPGTYTFNNNYTHNNGATLSMELENISSYDIVDVTGNVILSGTLEVSLLNGYTPITNDSFTILTSGSLSGTFDTTSLPPGYTWNVNYSATSVTLEVTGTLSMPTFNIDNIKLSPNPATNQISISGLTQNETIEIYNLAGQKILETEVNTNNNPINISKFSNGLYFLKLKGATFKFIKE